MWNGLELDLGYTVTVKQLIVKKYSLE